MYIFIEGYNEFRLLEIGTVEELQSYYKDRMIWYAECGFTKAEARKEFHITHTIILGEEINYRAQDDKIVLEPVIGAWEMEFHTD